MPVIGHWPPVRFKALRPYGFWSLTGSMDGLASNSDMGSIMMGYHESGSRLNWF